MSNQPLEWNAKLIAFFVSNARLVWMLIIAILVGGTVSLVSLKRAGFPEVPVKIALVQTVYPGASAHEVESQVTKEIESAIKDAKGLKEFSSSSQNSFSLVRITLAEDANVDQSIQDIQTKVQSIQANLPQDVETPKVISPRTGGYSFIFGITAEGSQTDIRTKAKTVIDEITSLSGIKSAELLNERAVQVKINYRVDDLKARGVSLTTLNQVIQGMNVDFPVGRLDIDNKSQSVVSAGAYNSLDQIRDTIVGANPVTGQPVRLRDVATVETGLEETDQIERFGYNDEGRHLVAPGVLLGVDITKEADIISVRKAIDDLLDKKRDEGVIGSDVKVVPLSDQAISTRDQIDEIVGAALGARKNLFLLGGLQLLILAILLFVNWRAAIIAGLSIPLSLGVTFIFLALTGTALNTIVLFSLILVLGLVVDPAIVLVEAVQRYRDLSYKPTEAVIESGRRYGASLFMAVLTSVIVFVPFGVVSGVFGEIIKYIPLTVMPALIASYFVPVALLPLLTKGFLKSRPLSKDAAEHEGLSKAAEFVMRVNRWVLAKTWREIMVLVIALACVAASVSIVATGKVKTVQFSTPVDNQYLQVSVDFKKGLPLSERDKLSQNVEVLIFREPSVKQYFFFSQSRNSLTLFVELLEKKERKASNQKSKAIMARIEDGLKSVPNLSDAQVKEVSSGPPESDYQVQTQLFSNDSAKLEAAAKDVGGFLAKQEHITKVDDGFTDQGEPEVRIVLDRAKVQQAGLSTFEVGQQLKSVTDQAKAGRYNDPATGQTFDIVLISASKPVSIQAIKDITLTGRTGTTVKVSDIASVEESTSVGAIQRSNGSRYVNVRARVDDTKNTASVQKELDNYLTKDKLDQLGLNSRANKGDFEDIARSFRQLGIALLVAVFLTYIVLVLQFKSFSQPVIMLFTIPLSFIGVFPALYLTRSDLGFLELLGVTILVGIVENVAIFLIDYANQLVSEKGVSAREAIIQSSGVRFRPILLTKLVALGGLLPLAIESDFWRGLSVVIIAGIGLSGFFSLVVIPILYVWISGLRARVHR